MCYQSSFSIEFPSGLVDPGETLQTAAKRELAEETGYSASEIRVHIFFCLYKNSIALF